MNNEASIAKQARIAAPPPELQKKTPSVLMRGMTPQRPLAHSLRECGLSIFNAFDIPRFSNPCRDSKYHRYDFEFLEQSPVNNKQANDTSQFMRHSTKRKTKCSIAAKQRTLGSERKAHRICPSTSRTFRPCLHAPAARHHPGSSSIPTRKDGVS